MTELTLMAEIADIIGVMLVVASLIYVAREVRQNTDMMKAEGATQRVLMDAELNWRISDSRPFAELWSKAGNQFNSLDVVDQTRILFFTRSALVHWHNMFLLYQKKMLPDEDWREIAWLIQELADRQDLAAAWRAYSGGFSTDFQQFIAGQLPRDAHAKHQGRGWSDAAT